MTGIVHSIESFGTVDGPGIRMVVFLKGCPMRCLYCHNPDTWDTSGGILTEAADIIDQFEKSRHFYTNGGITVTGGEPLVQIDFVIELFSLAHKKGIHTCLDTSGITFQKGNRRQMEKMDSLLEVTDLIMLDIKHIEPDMHRKLCGQPLEPVLDFACYLDKKKIPVWIRHVVVPGFTDQESSLYKLGHFIGGLHNVTALDVLPYHDMGKAKYEKLGMDYPLKDIAPLTQEDAASAKKIIISGMKSRQLVSTD